MVRTIRNSSIEASPLALCVPVIGGGKPYALIYMEKNRPEARPFDKTGAATGGWNQPPDRPGHAEHRTA